MLSGLQQSFIFCLGQSDPSDLDDIVPQLLQKPGRDRLHVLVEQEPHAGVGVRWISSTETKAIAYRMQAWMSSSVRSW